MEFNTKKRLLTKEEKLRRAIFFYTYENYDFNLEYEDEEPSFDEYGQPLVKIEENISKLDDKTKALVYEFAEREIYDETIDFKCLKCDYEEQNIDYEEIEEIWDGENYPKLICPKCGRNQFVPLDIWKQKNKYKKY